LLLKSLAAAPVEEGLGILVGIVASDLAPGDLARGQGPTLPGGHHADHIVLDLKHLLERHLEDAGINAIGARWDDRDLGSPFSAAGKEPPCILE